MSELAIFVIGSFIFAITVYGSVMAGGLALTRAEENALPLVADDGPEGPVAVVPTAANPAGVVADTKTDPI